MSVRILTNVRRDDDQSRHAVLFCSTTEWAFGPVFYDDDHHDADERAEAFCRWLGTRDPRSLTDAELERAHTDWRAQESDQWKAEAVAGVVTDD